ncbi:DUF4179 domain-containing protein [Bacillus gaemokensis]|uniref:ECF-type sigma factor negative effector n=1 Tax=Bacillus gaemokensis TaxID=574375 RepID=A0A073KDX5_9BACI|nr:DUF4179 domain-containing protein [Bacillus gaemokensis]KEK24672.1 ECF-type sigma factor negative effector [Bacillus gaemokensis]KYG34492.1 anti-sigma factor [Bacillus gaemokensis]
MKDVYELLNDIEIDEKGFEEIEASEFEKEKVKRNLKQAIHKKKKTRNWKKRIAVASVLVGLSVATLGIGFPTYAGSLPIVGDIFRFLDNGRTGVYDNAQVNTAGRTGLHYEYKKHATEINMTKESKGIKVTINDAVFDGKTVSLTYSIESDQDLGENPSTFDFLNIKGAEGISGRNKISKVDKGKYVGLVTASNITNSKEDKVNIEWDIRSIRTLEKQEEIKGNWNFALTLKASNSKEQSISGSSEKDGVKVNMEKIAVTPMSFILYYNQEVSKDTRKEWDDADVELEIKDDLGNHYAGEGNGGTSTAAEPYKSHWSTTFQKLNENATKLIVTPHVNLRIRTPENYGGVEMSGGKEKKIEVPKREGKNKDIVLDDIIIDLKK